MIPKTGRWGTHRAAELSGLPALPATWLWHQVAVSLANQKLPAWKHSSSPARLFPATCFKYQFGVLCASDLASLSQAIPLNDDKRS